MPSIFPDEPTEEERQQKLPEDNDTPFRPADDPMNEAVDQPGRRREGAQLDDTHQATDTNLQYHEMYDEGYSGAAEASEPNAGNAVVGYDPERVQGSVHEDKDRGDINAAGRTDMEYAEFVSTVQEYDPDLSVDDAEDTLQMTVELIAVHLDEVERREVANELPGRLQDITLAVLPSDENATEDLVEQAMDMQGVDEREARNRLRAAWQALKDGLSERMITIIEGRLPSRTLTVLET